MRSLRPRPDGVSLAGWPTRLGFSAVLLRALDGGTVEKMGKGLEGLGYPTSPERGSPAVLQKLDDPLTQLVPP